MAKKVTKAEAVAAKAESDNKLRGLMQKHKELYMRYKNEPKKPVTLQPAYAARLGSRARIAVNGIAVYIPCNGETYNINETHANEAMAKVRKINKLELKQQQLSKISRNFESTPGELKF